ncbi:MAG TPA: T9SS type A sorting domain-containing protein [Flavobacteriaceae bacterium]|nr:T9SS type A sorting domain-containing protein [Flavobacteriaceae bacterium]
MKLLLIFILSPFLLISQTQIGNDIDGLAAGDHSGYVSFSNDGTVVAIGGPGNDDAGADAGQVRVFENSSGYWVQIGNAINGQSAGDHFGSSVSLSGNGAILAIGSPDTEIAGYVRVYENIGDVWTQIGEDINGESEGIDEIGSPSNFSFGRSVSISDNGIILAIGEGRGSSWESGYGNSSHIHIYENIAGIWTQTGNYIGTISYINDMSMSADGSTVIVSGSGDWDWWYGQYINGAIVYNKKINGDWTEEIGFYGANEDFTTYTINNVSLSDNGSIIAFGGTSIKVFRKIDEDWVQQGEDIENQYGSKISLSDDGYILACSIDQSLARVYKYNSGSWTQLGADITEEASGDNFGASLELSSDGTKLAVGSPQNDGNGIDSGNVRVYDLSALLSSDDFVLTQFSLFPNPAKDQFTISLNESIKLDRINIYNHLAQLISSTKETTVNTSNLSSGMYFVEVITDKGKATKKLILK